MQVIDLRVDNLTFSFFKDSHFRLHNLKFIINL